MEVFRLETMFSWGLYFTVNINCHVRCHLFKNLMIDLIFTWIRDYREPITNMQLHYDLEPSSSSDRDHASSEIHMHPFFFQIPSLHHAVLRTLQHFNYKPQTMDFTTYCYETHPVRVLINKHQQTAQITCHSSINLNRDSRKELEGRGKLRVTGASCI